MILPDKVLLVGIIFSTASVAIGEERRDVQTRGETRRLTGAYIRRRRPAAATAVGDGGHTPPYAVPMEPLVKYSQRDPLYDKSAINNHTNQEFTSRGDYESEGTNNVAELTAGPRLDYGYSHHQQQYYQEPEPIIEIIIKESNESLPAPTTLPPPPSTKEPVHVFYVKYRKNPHATGKDGESDVIYEPPVPALTQHESDTIEPDPEAHHTPVHVTETPHYLPTQTTTLRTIIRPDSEIYHGSGLKITFGSPDHHIDRREHELDESASEIESRLPERQQRDQAQNRESSDISPTPKSHYFKRQQGPYFPTPQPTHNLQDLTPPPPSQQYQLPVQGRQAIPNHSTQAIYNRGNHKPSHPSLQSGPPFRPQQQQQQTAATFQRNHHYNPSQSPQIQINFPSNQQGQQSQRYNEPARQPTQTPGNFRQRSPPQNKFEGGEQQRRPQFQPTLEAQIEEYQKHKLFLHQQNLRHQAQQAEQASQAQLLAAQNQQLNARNPQQGLQHQGSVQYQPIQPIHVQSPPGQSFQREQLGFQVPKKNTNNLPNRHSFSSHQPREPINLDLNSRGKVPSQNFVTPQPINSGAPFNPSATHPSEEKAPFVPSPQHIPPQNQQAYVQPSQPTFNQNAGVDYSSRNNDFLRLPSPTYSNAEIVKTISPIEDIDIKSDGESGSNLQSETDSQSYSRESHTSEKPGQVTNQPDQNAYSNHKISPSAENHRYEAVHSSTTTSKPRPTFTSRTSGTTSAPPTEQTKLFSLIPSSTPTPLIPDDSQEQKQDESGEESPEQQEKKKANLAALPDEVPDDLREQLLSSGILGNADIQILDYDKVGDIPIESLPPEALENLYGAGSAPVPSVVMPDSIPNKKSVEMKVVRYDPSTKEGQGLADTYLRSDATQLDPVVLNDNRYNRYLPLKISGSNFPLPDVPQLKNRIVNSVVVLAPVDYDFIKTQDDVDRSGRTIQVEGVRFIAGDSLKTLVKDPSLTNYNRWLDIEKETPTGRQSVVLLVTSPTTSEKTSKANKMEIFMYDVATSKVSKLRGELSSTFVEVAESNSGSEELEELASGNDETSPTAP